MTWPHIDIAVSFRGARGVYGSPGPAAPLNGVLLNPQPSGRSGREPRNYLIVVADSLASEITPFANAKTAQGFSVTTYSVDTRTTKEAISDHWQSRWYEEGAPKGPRGERIELPSLLLSRRNI